KKFNNWVNNIMEFNRGDSGSAHGWESVTNVEWVKNGVLARFTTAALDICNCPADNFLSDSQKKLSWTRRLRSNSMNARLGLSTNDPKDNSAKGLSWAESGSYRQFLKAVDVPNPALTWVTVDER